MSAILNLLHIKSGSITVDNVSISEISRDTLRCRLNTLPQEGVILDGTIRDSLNSDGHVSDDRMIECLSKLNLWKIFEQQEGLDSNVSEETLSHGQRQLFCFARAILRPGKIVLMDESTSRYVWQQDPRGIS